MAMRALVVLALLASVHAQANVPDLATVTQATALETSTTGATTGATSATTATTATGKTTGTTTATTGSTSTGSSSSSSAATTAATTGTTTSQSTTGGSSTSQFSLTGLPTIAGAGVPPIGVPYTANAPFMQKSNLPEGTVFIAVGAVLAFLGACVLLWRGLVAWSINRSVKRSARAAVLRGGGGSEKTSTWNTSSSGKGAYYKEYEAGSSMSLDALTSSGKHIRTSHADDFRKPSAPTAGLFFSPTAQASHRVSSAMGMGDRNSSFLPAGYYPSPSADIAGGRASTQIGSSLAPYARHSSLNPSPPESPGIPNSRGTYMSRAGGTTSRDGLRANDAMRAVSRDGYGSRSGSIHGHHSTSSLAVGIGGGPSASTEHLGGQRAPSAVLDEMFENHGLGPRERS